jgi:hypothetical protein
MVGKEYVRTTVAFLTNDVAAFGAVSGWLSPGGGVWRAPRRRPATAYVVVDVEALDLVLVG